MRNVFDMSHSRKLSCDMGKLVPILCEEVLPGDFWKGSTSFVIRLTPMVAPMMHEVEVFTHFFFVPNRLIWTNWESFITGGETGTDATVWPYKTFTSIAVGSLADYLGCPVISSSKNISILPFRSYATIYNEWYRDQVLQSTKIVVSKGDGADTTTSVELLTRNWEKDYFTSSLNAAQKGTAVSVPLGTSATVKTANANLLSGASADGVRWLQNDGSNPTLEKNVVVGDSGAGNAGLFSSNGTDTKSGYSLYPTNLYADLSGATASTISELRLAFQIQKFMEKSMRGGSRYTEFLKNFFNVLSSDARLQRPEYLGGGRSPIHVSEVLQTSEAGTTPQGTMAGHGFAANVAHSFSKTFEEHGYIIGLMSLMPSSCYQQGLPRSFSRDNRYDYFNPVFQNLSEQAVLKQEVYCDPSDGHDEEVFGYQGRWDEYRRRESSVHGLFKTTGVDGLAHWHMGRIFSERPTLGSSFITCDPTERVFAVAEVPHVYAQIRHNIRAVRPLPLVAEPGLIDH